MSTRYPRGERSSCTSQTPTLNVRRVTTLREFQKVVAHDAQSAINQVENLINKYTK